MPHGVTQCHLPPSRADIPALNPADSATLEGCKAELTYPPQCGVGGERSFGVNARRSLTSTERQHKRTRDGDELAAVGVARVATDCDNNSHNH